jgi:hypothetical protein
MPDWQDCSPAQKLWQIVGIVIGIGGFICVGLTAVSGISKLIQGDIVAGGFALGAVGLLIAMMTLVNAV